MNIRKIAVVAVSGVLALFLCSCIGIGTKFNTPTDDQLVFGKLKPAEAITFFGKPHSEVTKTTADGNYVVYKYVFAENSFGIISERVLLMEFKENVLNGYFWWSSFKEDKTKVDLKNVDKLRAGIGKLTKEDVLALVGKPNGKALCPSVIEDFKERCDKNTEVWGWYMEEQYDVHEQPPKNQELFISFGANGKVSGVETVDQDHLR